MCQNGNKFITEMVSYLSAEINSGVFVFGEEAKRNFLQAKIRRYLALTISIEDKLPKMICQDCYTKLDGFHKFATMALKNQEKMSKLICNNAIEEKFEKKSLLHTYLTKGVIEKEGSFDGEVTEMEVRVDPMIILQYCLDGDENTEYEDNSNDKIDDTESENKLKIDENNQKICENQMKRKDSKKILNSSSDNMQEINRVQPSLLTTEGDKETENVNNINMLEKDENGNNNDINSDDDLRDEYKNMYSCPICGKKISTKGNLKVHLETHRPKGKYGCDICGRIFKTQCNLYRHKEYHGGIQYPCGVCGRVYPTNSTLRAHSITHSNLRPHKCPLCDKTFKRNQDLKFHINQHTGARPYQCPYCPKAFASSGNCFSHRKRMHPVEVERDRERAAKIMR